MIKKTATVICAFICALVLATERENYTQKLTRLEALTSTLNLGLKVLKDAGLPSRSYQSGDLIRRRLRAIKQDLKSLKQGAYNETKLQQTRNELLDIEKRTLRESIKVINLSPLSPNLQWRPDKCEKRTEEYIKEMDYRFKDWSRHERTLDRFNLKASAKTEIERVKTAFQNRSREAMFLDRDFEQAMEFYKRVAEERFRQGAAIIAAEQELVALSKTAKLKRELGSKIVISNTLIAEFNQTLASWKYNYNSANYSEAFKKESLANDILQKIKNALFVKDDKTPIIRPGASFLSAGTFAYGGSWQTLLNTMAKAASFYRDAYVGNFTSAFYPYDNTKFTWTVSFGINGSSFDKYTIKDGAWTYAHRVNHFVNPSTQEESRQDCYWSSLAPGVLFDTHAPSARFSDDTLGNPIPPSKILGVFNGNPRLIKYGKKINTSEMTEGWLLLLWENNAPQTPVLIFFEKRPDALSWNAEGLIARRSPEVGKYAAAMPYGAAPKPVKWSASWKSVPDQVVARCRQTAEKLAFFPLSVDEFYAVDTREIKIWNRLDKFIILNDDWNTNHEPYIPAPPLYAFALKSGSSINFEQTLSPSLMETKFGFFQTAKGTKLNYSIPAFRMWQRVPLKPSGEEELLKTYNAYLPNNSEKKRVLSCELLAFVNGWLLMNNKTRNFFSLNENFRVVEDFIKGEFVESNRRTIHLTTDLYIDPLTGRSAWLRGWRGTRHEVAMRGDPTCFNMMGLAGAYALAKTLGFWESVERHWKYLQRLYSFAGFRQGWAVPGQDCLSTGWIFYGDMLGDGLRANSLMAEMSKVIGDEENAALATYLFARTMASVGALTHPNIINYNARVKNTPEALAPNAAIQQLGTTDIGFITKTWTPYTKKSWNAPFQSAGCVIYDYPFFGSLLESFPQTTKIWINRFMNAIPEWCNREYRGSEDFYSAPRERNYNAWQTLKYIALSSQDKDEARRLYRAHFTPPANGFSRDWRQCNNWIGFGSAMPYIIARNDPLWLGEWDKAQLISGEYNRETRHATIKLKSFTRGELSMVSLAKPISVIINGENVTDNNFRYEKLDGSLVIPFLAGESTIEIELPEAKSSYLKYPDYAKQALGDTLNLPKAPCPGKYNSTSVSGNLQVGKCESIDISSACDMGFSDPKAGDKKGGTDDNGDTWIFPKGNTIIRGVPFTFIDPSQNNNVSCVVLNGKAKPFFPESAQNILVNKVFKRLFFLHGLGYGTGHGDVALTYILRFEGGQTRSLTIKNGFEIGEWKAYPGNKVLPDLPAARAGRLFPAGRDGQWGEGVSGYVYEWKNDVNAPGVTNADTNQQGLARLKSIDIISSNNAVPIIFAITGEL